MTEKEKAKAYDDAIERAKKLHDKINIEEIFPELKESDDMKIKNAILNYFKKMWGNCQDDVCGVRVEDAIDWIEKQGEQTSTLEKPIKPKFKVGDTISNKPRKYMGAFGTQGTISEITEDNYYVFTDGSYVSIYNQDSWGLLTDKKQKFDPKTLQPFDKVLVYDIYDTCEGWACALFSHIRESDYPYSTSSGSFKVCIPYNDETKHLLGTTDEAPEYYRYW